jgi:DUF971 family protein
LDETRDVPVRIDIRRVEAQMEIEWKTGAIHRLPLDAVRGYCPCAVCVAHRSSDSQQSDLHVLTAEEEGITADVDAVTPVGRYAIQIKWADGHDTGIYTFDYLKSLWVEIADKQGN